MESVSLLKNTYRTNSKWKKRKYCEKEKDKKENREATLNISNNSPRILVAEKTTKKKQFSA
jgi:hypothetical protein